ncbi:MAG TPA: DUF4390 domain-containing protein [Longimicrobiales bacterium]|nr:DUF4390 domain-containing protein [Longimicrobiales bacterium]
MQLALILALVSAANVAAQPPPDDSTQTQQRPLAIVADAANGHRPIVRVGPVLAEDELEEAATSGLPLRVRVRVELWKDRLFDQLVDSTSWSTVVVHEPISEQFFVRSLPATRGSRRASSFASAREAVESEYVLSMRPRGEGRYYYTVSLQIETLSVSDLEELERWLQGELQPAVSGERSVPGAIGQGAKRLMLRILDLPERRYEARTGRFRID